MNEIKLRAKRKHADEWLLFGITELFHGENGCFQVCVEDVGFFSIYPATIQLADDPRKQMLDEIRKRINAIPSPKSGDDYFDDGFSNAVSKISEILDEMEAKL